MKDLAKYCIRPPDKQLFNIYIPFGLTSLTAACCLTAALSISAA